MMSKSALGGVIAAIATPIDQKGEPDCARATRLARFLLDNGCDGLNVLGTTGEATSFSLAQRQKVMNAYVYVIVTATAAKPIPIYLYHYPALSGLPWHPALIRRLLDAFGGRLAGLKDSSGDMAYAREAAKISPSFKVFPSTEAVLLEARSGAFAGCISATVNLNADLCQRAWKGGDAVAHDAAVTIRKLFEGRPLVPGVKALLAHIHGDAALARVMPPLAAFSPDDTAAVVAGYDQVRAKR